MFALLNHWQGIQPFSGVSIISSRGLLSETVISGPPDFSRTMSPHLNECDFSMPAMMRLSWKADKCGQRLKLADLIDDTLEEVQTMKASLLALEAILKTMKTKTVRAACAFVTIACFCLIACGCRPKWEYQVLRFENSASVDHSETFMSRTNTTAEWLKKLAFADNRTGYFDLEAQPPIAGMKSIEPDLATLGKQGWELVAAVPQTETIGDAKVEDGDKEVIFSNVRTVNIYLIFKREK